jgi:hypothetical protein
MNLRLKKALAIATMPLAGAGLVVGLMTAGPAFAADSTQPTAASGASGNVGDTTTTAATTTVPWCGWYINGLTNTITLTGATTYTGDAVDLSGSSGSKVEAFVNGSSTYESTASNCSWYKDSNKLSARLSVGVKDGQAMEFKATTTKDPTGATDKSMNFSLDAEDKLNITATKDTNCTDNGFTGASDASVYGTTTSSYPVSSSTSRAGITTKNYCSWTMTYATRIPANKTPKYGKLTYTYTGPVLVTTLEVSDTAS